jgi:hypothetical protein
MFVTLDQVKRLYDFKILDLLKGEDVVKHGKCSQWARHKEQKNDKDVIYIQLKVVYKGEESRSILYVQFHLEDAEGYFSDAMPPEDYLEKVLGPGQTVKGGLLFAQYCDVAPCRLWFNTSILYENSANPILLDIALPLPESETRSQIFARQDISRAYRPKSGKPVSQEELALSYTQDIASNLSNCHIIPAVATENVIKEVSQQCNIPYRKITHGYLLRVFLPGGRKQNVIVNFSGKDEQGGDLVTIGTICAPAREKEHDRSLLKMNPQMTCGAIGISPIKGEDFYVITKTYPVASFSREVAIAAIRSMAAKGDSLENDLTGGQDVQ